MGGNASRQTPELSPSPLTLRLTLSFQLFNWPQTVSPSVAVCSSLPVRPKPLPPQNFHAFFLIPEWSIGVFPGVPAELLSLTATSLVSQG